ncbi:MAG: Cyclin-dependent kinase 2 [Chaenotheca gracillima]|nr:MAG: Cyclin-dependent kinase 2 [Chaenotheca gracillima]
MGELSVTGGTDLQNHEMDLKERTESDRSGGSSQISLEKSSTASSGKDLPGGEDGLQISDFERLEDLGEGTDGVVFRARKKDTFEIVAIKHLNIQESADHPEPIPNTVWREISLLKTLNHANIVNVIGVAANDDPSFDQEMYMVMEYVEQDLSSLIDGSGVQFRIGEDSFLKGLGICTARKSDVKMSNLLLNSQGVLKIADFGMARDYVQGRAMTGGVVTIWYRSPELLLGAHNYTQSIDLWGAGLILAELLISEPLLQGERELEQLNLIVRLLGDPTKEDFQALSDMGCPELAPWTENAMEHRKAGDLKRRFPDPVTDETVDFLRHMLTWDPNARYTAIDALGGMANDCAEKAKKWWDELPRAIERADLPSYSELQSAACSGGDLARDDAEQEIDDQHRRRCTKRPEPNDLRAPNTDDFVAASEELADERTTKRHRPLYGN